MIRSNSTYRFGARRVAPTFFALCALMLATVATVVPVASVAAATSTSDGLVDVQTSVVGPGLSLCDVSLHVTQGTTVSSPIALSSQCSQKVLASVTSGTVQLVEPAGATTFSVAPRVASTHMASFFGGACETNGTLRVESGMEQACTLTLYPVLENLPVGGGAGPTLTHTIVTTERVVVPNSPVSLVQASNLLCATQFQIGLINRNGALTSLSAGVGNCAQQQPTVDTADRIVSTTTIVNGVFAGVAGPFTPGVSDNFNTPGYVTTYSAGCTPAGPGFAQFQGDQQPLTCTITHTFTGGATSTSDGLVDVQTSVVGPGLSLCDVSLHVTQGTTVSSPIALSSQCSQKVLASVTSGTVQLVEPAGATTFSVAPRVASTHMASFFGGACETNGTLRVESGMEQACTLTLYPVLENLPVGGGAGPTLTHTIVTTERVVVPNSPVSLVQASNLLCATQFQIGLINRNGALTSLSAGVGNCAQQQPTVDTADRIVSTTTIVNGVFAGVAGPFTPGVSDNFNTPGYVTTYSAGCTPAGPGFAQFQGDQQPLTCTITHTFTGGATSTSDGLVDVQTSVVGPGLSLCDVSLHVTQGTTVSSPIALSSQCSQKVLASVTSGTVQLVEPAGATTFSVAPRVASTHMASFFGGACETNGTLRVESGMEQACTLTLYPVLENLPVGGGAGPTLTHTIVTTERVVVPNSPVSLVQASNLLCATQFQIGLINRNGALTSLSAGVGNCAQQQPTVDTADRIVSTTTIVNGVFAGVAGPFTPGVSDNFNTPGYVTTYSAGCTPAGPGFAQFQGDQQPLTCTITHTFTGGGAPPVATSTTSVSCPASAGVDGTMFCDVTVSVPAGSPTPSGDVTVSPGNETCDIGTDPCSVFVPTGATVGADVTVEASYGGQTGITASSGGTTVPITLRATDIAMDCSSQGFGDGSATAGAPITCALTVTDLDDPFDFTPDGSVSATAGSDTETCTLGQLPKSCEVVFSGGLPTGQQVISSSYGGDGTEFAGSTATDSISVS